MLNPSTADETKNDPTVLDNVADLSANRILVVPSERCERRARATKECGGVEIINIFAYRATDPSDMKLQADPIGPDNDMHILAAAKSAYQIILAWGVHGQYMDRGKQVLNMLQSAGVDLYYLKLNKDGFPAHPLYISYDKKTEQLI